jgi:hypothetical protein
MSALVLFAAGGETLITILLVIFFVVVPAIGQLLMKMKEGGPPQAAPRPPRPQDRSIQEEIDAFLRRASQRRGDRPMQSSPVEELQRQATVTAEVVEEEAPVGGRMGRRVQQDLDTSEFGRRSAQMGGEVSQADQQFEQRADQVFGHEVSRLSMRPGAAAAAPQADESSEAPEVFEAAMTATGSGVATLLGDPDSILQAIIMSEILKRPDDRWE